MSVGAVADLCVQWNEDYDESWSLSDPVTGAPTNLTGWTLKLQVRASAGAPGNPLLALAYTTDPTATGIYMPQATSGVFTPRMAQADLEALAVAGGQQSVLRYAYDFVATDSAGVKRALVSGAFILTPGVTL